jgi:hypothetical protein
MLISYLDLTKTFKINLDYNRMEEDSQCIFFSIYPHQWHVTINLDRVPFEHLHEPIIDCVGLHNYRCLVILPIAILNVLSTDKENTY